MSFSQAQAGQPALFLDRDGVINIDHGYVHRPEEFDFVDGIFELALAAQDAGMRIVVVTNQAGIGRGYFSEAEFQVVTAWMKDRFRERGVIVDAVYHCPYHPEHGVGKYKLDSFDRKPNPGMIIKAQRDLGIDLSASAMVGDSVSDIQAARNAGVGRAILLASNGYLELEHGADLVVSKLDDARKWLFDPTSVKVQTF